MLPPNVGITRGEILATSGQRSPELDIIIYDKTVGGVLFPLGDIDVVAVESVVAVLSVRTTLDLTHLDEMVTLAQELRGYPRIIRPRAGQRPTLAEVWPPDADPAGASGRR